MLEQVGSTLPGHYSARFRVGVTGGWGAAPTDRHMFAMHAGTCSVEHRGSNMCGTKKNRKLKRFAGRIELSPGSDLIWVGHKCPV